MRRFRWIGILLTFVLVGTTASVASAGSSGAGVPPGGNRVLRGRTSQGQKIQIVMHRVRGGWGVQEIDFGAVTRCEDGTRLGSGTGIFFFGPQALDGENGFDLDEADIFEALHIHGRIGPRGGSGTLEETLPALTQTEKAQRCTTKERAWSVRRTSPALDATCCDPHAAGLDSVVRLTTEVDGTVAHVSRSLDQSASRQAGAGQTRVYVGKTSQGRRARLATRESDQSRRLTDADFGFGERCDDGNSFSSWTGFGFGGRGGPHLDDAGHFGFDSVDIFGAFHLRGRIGAHAGSGSVSETEAALTQDEQAMLCTSKERNWQVNRLKPATPVPSGTMARSTAEVRMTTR